MKLCDLSLDKKGVIKNICAEGLLKERLLSLGFINNSKISPIRKGSKNNLTIYEVCHNLIALRKEDASLIEVDYIE